jgi:hypothetical protein
MIYHIFVWKYFLFQFQQHIKHWAKPATLSLISGVLSDLTRSRSDLIVENALLRQQLIVLNRQVKRPLLTRRDRFLLVLLARFSRFWKQTPSHCSARHTPALASGIVSLLLAIEIKTQAKQAEDPRTL